MFNGSLKDAVNSELVKSGKYTSEELSLSKSDNGYKDSKSKGMLLELIRNIAVQNNIAQVLYFNILNGQNEEIDKLESVNDEFEKSLLVTNYYQSLFFNYLFTHINVDEQLKNRVIMYPNVDVYMQELCDIIEINGLENYKKIVQSFNVELESKQSAGELLTPEQIVGMFYEKNKSL